METTLSNQEPQTKPDTVEPPSDCRSGSILCSLPSPFYDKDGITIYHRDCRDILPALSEFDVLLTDPPYGVGLTHKQHKWFRQNGNGYASTTDDAAAVNVAVEVISQIVATGQRCVLTPCTRHAWKYPQPVAVDCAFNKAGAGMHSWGFQCGHLILYYGKDPKRPGCYPSGYEQHPNDTAPKNGHPCPKPERFWKWLTERVSVEGELIVDPFMGSGTTLWTAKLLGRRAVGIEIEERYCEIAANRLAQGVLF